MNVIETALAGVLILEPPVHEDARGFLLETYRLDQYRREAGIDVPFVQDNQSRSRRGVLRGLHAQLRHPQGKLVRAARGEIFDVAVDLRRDSPTFGRWTGTQLSDRNHRQIWIPPGCAHGFVVLSEEADVAYKCTDYYRSDDEIGVVWNDPDVGIDWPVREPILSEKDARLPRLTALKLAR